MFEHDGVFAEGDGEGVDGGDVAPLQRNYFVGLLPEHQAPTLIMRPRPAGGSSGVVRAAVKAKGRVPN
jgi:hypothetical protein